METRIEGLDSRTEKTEQNLERLGSDVEIIKEEMSSLRKMLADFMKDSQGGKKRDESQNSGNGEEDHEHEREKEEGTPQSKGGDDSGTRQLIVFDVFSFSLLFVIFVDC